MRKDFGRGKVLGCQEDTNVELCRPSQVRVSATINISFAHMSRYYSAQSEPLLSCTSRFVQPNVLGLESHGWHLHVPALETCICTWLSHPWPFVEEARDAMQEGSSSNFGGISVDRRSYPDYALVRH